MTPAQLVVDALRVSVIAMVFAIGLGVSPGDLLGLLRRPGLLARSLVSIFVVMLVAAVGVALVANLRRPIEIVMVALALAPIPPLLPRKETKAGGETGYIYGLLVAAALFAIVWIPLGIALVSRITGVPLSAGLLDVVKIVVVLIVAPLVAGALIHRYAPAFADRIRSTVARLATLVLLAGLVLILAKTWRTMLDLVGNGTLLALAGFVVVGIVSGQLLGGPRAQDRSVLALATASRHPGIAYYLATLNFPQEKAIPAAVVLYLLVSALLALPYVAWRRRSGAANLLEA
jgi:BASS family bile acid:Na+ symporter